jgi:hypothetical protein
MSDFTIHNFIKMKRENKDILIGMRKMNLNIGINKSGIDTASFWSRFLLWKKPSIEGSYEDIKKDFKYNYLI